ncbi:DUF3142 domain-containing protein [Rhodanobacter sp. L36]|uniref:DUF3142 domain-containing protein n=1 Tax=Rhodanobacter sp. L36 TaxID=1747221 RepID=UPI00131C1A51|nr:DUF3142 domain-containing protein [Rhodanobacter sp. L36]
MLTHDAYIWQREWTPAVIDAMRDSGAAIRAWHVLAAQTDADGRLQVFHPDRAALRMSNKPVLLVVRIDGQLTQWDETKLLADTQALWHDWQSSGVRVAGLEIDHDCGTARLPAYTHFLSALRPLMRGATLSITALPAWLDSSALDALLAQVDESVLQVHAVRDPRAGMFDDTLALHWANAYAQRSDKPFRIALPTYGSRVSWDANGRIASVQSESPVLDSGDDSRELLAMPQQIAGFIAQLQRDPPAHLMGIAWFRLPTARDDRAWSLATWLAVIRQQPLKNDVLAVAQPSTTPGMLDLLLRNPGELDAPLPTRVFLPPDCTLADGIQGYARQTVRDGSNRGTLSIKRLQPGLLQAHHQRIIGWARCAAQGVELHVEP